MLTQDLQTAKTVCYVYLTALYSSERMFWEKLPLMQVSSISSCKGEVAGSVHVATRILV